MATPADPIAIARDITHESCDEDPDVLPLSVVV